jgi:hypothetical protein
MPLCSLFETGHRIPDNSERPRRDFFAQEGKNRLDVVQVSRVVEGVVTSVINRD